MRHILQFYEMDKEAEKMKMCLRLTDEHIYNEKIKKIKVRNTAQIISQRFSVCMKRYADFSGEHFYDNLLSFLHLFMS